MSETGDLPCTYCQTEPPPAHSHYPADRPKEDPMTAQQLIEKLRKFPPDAQVFLDYGDPRGCVTIDQVASNLPQSAGDAYMLTEAAVKIAKAAHRMTFGAPAAVK